ncbi:MAG: hypothetical protein KFB96_13325 [Thiocapsa sp.]|uniref:hypothetical protein n=1 Tax=Thiocapsa sp. TaxID=2024551 RepID=UPI001BCC4FD6|nr:hypothetical protein [Thiocapsa sp.]QVL46746.1 MAG: hypothetical protein KFB96_13325 [Thiocapsa sp.]
MTEVDDTALDELIEQAQKGDQAATGELCRIASRALYAGGPVEMNPVLRRYLAASLSRVKDAGLARAFAPLGPQPAYIRKARKEMNDLSLVIWVDRIRSTMGLVTFKDGTPGPVFELVGKMLGRFLRQPETGITPGNIPGKRPKRRKIGNGQ